MTENVAVTVYWTIYMHGAARWLSVIRILTPISHAFFPFRSSPHSAVAGPDPIKDLKFYIITKITLVNFQWYVCPLPFSWQCGD